MIESLTTIRHSLTAHNLAQIITGRLDEPPSDTGRSLAANVPNIPVDTVVSSPSLRALQTAVLVTGRGPATIRVSPLCCERSYGELEGLDRHQIAKYRSRIHYLGSVTSSTRSIRPEVRHSIRFVIEQKNS